MAILKKSDSVETTTETKPTIETAGGFVPKQATAAPEQATAAPESQPNAVAVSQPNAVAAVAEKQPYQNMVSLRNNITPGMFGYGATKIIPSNGKAMVKPDGFSLGEHFDAQVLSFNTRWCVGPKKAPQGDSDAKFFFRDSYDNETVEDKELGTISIEEYIEKIITPKYPDGGEVKEYTDVIVAAIGCADKSKEDMFLEKMLYVVQLSPSVTKKFNFFAGTAGMKALSGRMSPEHQTCMRFVGADGPNKSYTYSIFTFESCPADVLAGYVPIDAATMAG